MKNLTIIGGGPASLMLAAQIDTTKYCVTLYEQKKTLGRKFLVAGEGGLNLTYNSSLEDLITSYSPSKFMEPIIRQFSNLDLMNWLKNKGIPTFIGSSNRVFPDENQKPIEVLNKILEHIKTKNIKFQLGTKWLGWNEKGQLCFEGVENTDSGIVVLALGGSSWKVTGSDGMWIKNIEEREVSVHSFRAANCAFGVNWSSSFLDFHEGKPLKNIALIYNNQYSKGELVISKLGLEGNAIYALSEHIQNTLLTEKSAVIYLDLKPTLTIEQVKTKFRNSKESNVTAILKRDLKLTRTAIDVLKEFTNKETFTSPDLLVDILKAVPITISSSDELDKAISTLGGVALNEIDANFQFKKIPNTFAIGEMLDWYAPTGGYLLQACFSMGHVLAKHLNELE